MNDWQFDDNQIECPHCGASFDLSLTHCPACGASVYPLEGEDRAWEGEVNRQPPTQLELLGHSVLLLSACGLVAGSVSLLAYIGVRNLFLSQAGFASLWTGISLCVVLGSYVGGYLAGRFARQRFSLHGILTGMINLITLLLLLAREFEAPLAYPWILLATALSLLAGFGGARLALRHLREDLVKDLFTPSQEQVALFNELLEKVRFDREIAERLIELEQKHDPGASRSALIQNAIRRWERDNR